MYQVGAACYASATVANQVQASAYAGSVVAIGGESYVLSVSGVNDTSVTYLYSPALAGGATVTQTVAMVPPACGLLTAADASEIAWMIAAAWIGAYCIKFIATAVQGMSSDEEKV